MVLPIGPTNVRPLELAVPRVTSAAAEAVGTPAADFADRVADALRGVDESHRTAQAMPVDFAEGNHGDLHGTMIALQEADIQLRLVANVRNKLIDAYREIMRMGA